MKGTDDYKSEEEYEAIFADRIENMNALMPMDGYTFGLNFAYGGVRLVKRAKITGGETTLSQRFYYDEDGTADYDAFVGLLDAVINVLRIAKENK